MSTLPECLEDGYTVTQAQHTVTRYKALVVTA